MQNTVTRLAPVPLLLALAAASAPAPAADEENWPNWRGPSFDGTSATTGLDAGWTLADHVVWRTDLAGPSAATPIVWGDRVFLAALVPESETLLAIAVDRAGGELLWERECGRGRRSSPRSRGRENTLAAGSPVTDGARVVWLFGSGDLVAFDFEGERLWRRDLVQEYGPFRIGWGYAASPLLLEGRLFVSVLQRGGSYVLAVDPATGETLWRVERPDLANAESKEAYTTPVPFDNEGRSEVLVLGGDCLTGHDPASGAERWRWCGLNPHNRPNFRTVSSPVVGPGGRVVVTSPQHNAMHGLVVRGTRVEKAWELEPPTPDSTTPLLYRGRLYAVDGRRGTIRCVDPEDGRVVWSEDLATPTFLRASPTGADGKVFVVDAEGNLVVLAAADEFRVLGRLAFDSYPTRSTVVPSRGQLLVRTAEHLYCIGEPSAPRAAGDRARD